MSDEARIEELERRVSVLRGGPELSEAEVERLNKRIRVLRRRELLGDKPKVDLQEAIEKSQEPPKPCLKEILRKEDQEKGVVTDDSPCAQCDAKNCEERR